MVLIMKLRVMTLVAVTIARGGGGAKLTQVPPGDNGDGNGDDGGENVS